MAEPPLLEERRGGVATLTLNRPETGNAIDAAMARALLDAALRCSSDEDVRCVVLTGAGRLFCAGGDIKAFGGAGERLPALIDELTTYLHAAIVRFRRMDKPLVTAINGPAAGAGLGLAIMGDVAIAARSASFATAYRRIGLTPDAGASWLLPRLVGLRRAQEMMLGDARVAAEEAATIGLVSRTVDDERLADETQATADRLAASATGALARTRDLLLSSGGNSLEGHLELEARSIARTAATPEAQERLAELLVGSAGRATQPEPNAAG